MIPFLVGDYVLKKSERLTDMMIYLNNKCFFNLSDIMNKYTISKSTALRDVQALESIGMPIFAEHGRYGRYGILKNRLLPPIIFTVDEMYALYFSMLTLRDYQSTPFHLNVAALKQKFAAFLPEEHSADLQKMESVFRFASAGQVVESPLLKDIVHAAITDSVQNILYQRSNSGYSYTVQFLQVSSSYGQWYVTAYNFETRKLQVFRCDKIASISANEDKAPVIREKVKALLDNGFKDQDATDFEVAVTNKGVDMFRKENYPSMSLVYHDRKPFIRGYYNKNEEAFISKYFTAYGQEIRSIKPAALKKLIIEQLANTLDYFKEK